MNFFGEGNGERRRIQSKTRFALSHQILTHDKSRGANRDLVIVMTFLFSLKNGKIEHLDEFKHYAEGLRNQKVFGLPTPKGVGLH